MRIALDTGILVYAEGHCGAPADLAKAEASRALLDRLVRSPDHEILVAAQVLGELFTVLVRKAGRPAAAARAAVLAWREIFTVQPTTEAVLLDACDLAAERGLQIWDAVIVAAAAEAGCAWLIVEDAAVRRLGAHRGVRMIDPFTDTLPPALAARIA